MSKIAQIGMVQLRDSDLELAHADDDVRGMAVFDPYGHRLGEVDDLIVDEQERRARLLVIASGGILGLFESRRLVPVEAITRVDESVHVDRDHTRLRDLPADSHSGDVLDYDPELMDATAYADVYGFYGLIPFWSPGYVHPFFHRRGLPSGAPRGDRTDP